MYRTTIRNSVFFAALMGGLVAAGCSKEYEQNRIDGDSPRAAEVRSMIASLREGGTDGVEDHLRRYAASDLTDARTAALRATLREIVNAEAAELERLDRFGDDVYRASLRLTSGGRARTLLVLLVETDGALRWAGRN